MRIKTTFSACGLFLVVLTLVSLASAQNSDPNAPFDVTKPLSRLEGKYALEEAKMDFYRPTWAAIWKSDEQDEHNGHMDIVFWPPKYCQAVYVCPVPKKNYTAENFVTEDGLCEDTYIKYYPHAKKLLLRNKKEAEVEKFLMSNRLTIEVDKKKTALRVLNSEPQDHQEWLNQTSEKRTFDIDLKDKYLLVMTNSRMCQVNKVGSDFYPFFKKSIIADTTGKFPEWLNDGEKYLHSDALPPIYETPSGKTHDVLEYLKDLTWSNKQIGNQEMTCDAAETEVSGLQTVDNSIFKKVSAVSYTIHVPNTQFSLAEKSLTLMVPECHWFRLWVTETGEISKYKETMRLNETVDVFLNEGFYIDPHSNTAHPLPDAREMGQFRFNAERHDKRETRYVEMSFGFERGQPAYRQYFMHNTMQLNKFNVHIIRSPGCKLYIPESSDEWIPDDSPSATNGTMELSNMWEASTCTYSYFV